MYNVHYNSWAVCVCEREREKERKIIDSQYHL